MLVSALFIALLASASAEEPEPPAKARPPLCRQVRKAVKDDAPKRDVVSLIKNAEEVTSEEVECLRRGNLPGYAARKAQAQLVKRHGVGALPTSPVELWAVLPDPRTIAAGKVTEAGVLFGDLQSFLGFADTVEQRTIDEVLSKARASFSEAGVTADITLEPRSLVATNGVVWEGGAQRTRSVPAGVHYVLHVRIPDAIAAARAYKGDLLVGLGARVGVDIEAMVVDTVRETVWSELAVNGVPSVLVELDE